MKNARWHRRVIRFRGLPRPTSTTTTLFAAGDGDASVSFSVSVAAVVSAVKVTASSPFVTSALTRPLPAASVLLPSAKDVHKPK
jgi:hypothetical protein